MNDVANETLHLKKMEKAALHGMMLRERDLMQEQQKLQTDIQEVFAEIEERLGLEPGAINKTHRINLDAGTVLALPHVVSPETPATPEIPLDLPTVVAESIANGAIPAE